MGFGVTELLIVLAIVLVLFGAKKLRNIGGDLGGAIKNFKTAMKDEETKTDSDSLSNTNQQATIDNQASGENDGTIIEGTVENKDKDKV
jgi:sec-independent protein translocase protein TatA